MGARFYCERLFNNSYSFPIHLHKYVYEIRMIELNEYHEMNRRKIDMEKAYDIISDAHESVRIVHYILKQTFIQSYDGWSPF